MPYPPPPWTLHGSAFLSLHLVDRARAQLLVPPELRVLSVLPGRTLAGLYLASYGPGSTLEYHELIVVAALVRGTTKASDRPGFWVSHIYVDSTESVAGGRAIWGLPKELAEFRWLDERRVVVRQGERILCTVSQGPSIRLFRLPWLVPTFSAQGSRMLFFTGRVESVVGLTLGTVKVPPESPFADIGLGVRLMTTIHDQLTLVTPQPEAIS